MKASLVGGSKHPKIYVYTTQKFSKAEWQGARNGIGLLKVGYTDLDCHQRIKQQLSGVKMPEEANYELLICESALTWSGVSFKDHLVHERLVASGISRVFSNGQTEWFECTVDEVQAVISSIKSEDIAINLRSKKSFEMRPEQREAVAKTKKYFEKTQNKGRAAHFLWNAKMRFGKTFTTYQLVKECKFSRILVLTYKPAVEKNWREDLLNHVDFEDWIFKGSKESSPKLKPKDRVVWFASFQDALGVDESGKPKIKNKDIHKIDWDLVVIDEYHFGAWREAAKRFYAGDEDEEFSGDEDEKSYIDTPDLENSVKKTIEKFPLKAERFLYLSGTPFRAITEGEFLEDQIFDWTYAQEQNAKRTWSGEGQNPYVSLPQMHLMVYSMPKSLRDVATKNEASFSLTEFFRAKKDDSGNPVFVHEKEVQKWLDLLRGQNFYDLWDDYVNETKPALPFENLALLIALQHTVWFLPSVDACKAMGRLLTDQRNTFFRDYQIIVAAGNGAGVGEAALPPLERAIGKVPQDSKTITLTCGKLLTGVTVPAWAGIFMLTELKSPETYFQAAFRVQSPWTSQVIDSKLGVLNEVVHKEKCFVIDFSPNRALGLVTEYATKLRTEIDQYLSPEQVLSDFLDFMPIIMFDDYSMYQLEASDVISHLTRGITETQLARQWRSSRMLKLDIDSMEKILSNAQLLKSLENIKDFMTIKEDLEFIIAKNQEISPKLVAKEPLSKVETKLRNELKKKKETIKDKLRRFVQSLPTFMYLTDNREKAVVDILQNETENDLFFQVTGLHLSDFYLLREADVFNDREMDYAVWNFREAEDPSLSYSESTARSDVRGGWVSRANTKFAALIEQGKLTVGEKLYLVKDPSIIGIIEPNAGIQVQGIVYESPEAAAEACQSRDGWSAWSLIPVSEESSKQLLSDFLV